MSDTIALSRSTLGGLAFLSACQTAIGDEELIDEALYIAAGTLFAGYGGVIGSMWSISDRYAPEVARDVGTAQGRVIGMLHERCTKLSGWRQTYSPSCTHVAYGLTFPHILSKTIKCPVRVFRLPTKPFFARGNDSHSAHSNPKFTPSC